MLSPATNGANLSSLRIVSAQCGGRGDALFSNDLSRAETSLGDAGPLLG